MRQEIIDELKSTKTPIFIWGAGEVATFTKKKLNSNGIFERGYVIDKMYAKSDKDITRERLIATERSYILIRGFIESFFGSDYEIKNIWPGCKAVFTVVDLYEPDIEPITKDFYLENQKKFELVRNSLADKLSVESFDAFLETKITQLNDKLIPLIERKQFFFHNAPWIYIDEDVVIDCGAYMGDTIEDFCELRGNNYSKIIAFEPDEANYNKLLKNIEKNSFINVVALNMGVYCKKDVLHFSQSGTMWASVVENGESVIEVETIDNVVGNNNVTIIKMDIEGSEMDALYGARETIKKCRPILMISAYHKKDDIINIFNFINKTVNDYMFYFRCHKPITADAVLYAVPKEKLR